MATFLVNKTVWGVQLKYEEKRVVLSFFTHFSFTHHGFYNKIGRHRLFVTGQISPNAVVAFFVCSQPMGFAGVFTISIIVAFLCSNTMQSTPAIL